jgi:GAF domain-containing protein
VNPVLQVLLETAVDATGAGQGWIVAVDGDELRVVNAKGHAGSAMVGSTLPAGSGSVGFVVASGQPLALTPRADDPRTQDDLVASLGEPLTSVVCVPCGGDDAVHGALQLVNKAGGEAFSFDDVELATLLAGIAGAALEASGSGPDVRSPAELGADLARLADADPAGYARLALVVGTLLDRA